MEPDEVTNPFYVSGPVDPSRLLGRAPELRRIFDRLATGQSVLITGQPHVGKTSVLRFIMNGELRRLHRQSQFDAAFFCFVDAQLLPSDATPGEFWKLALEPLGEARFLPAVGDSYRRAKKGGFESFALRRLFSDLEAAKSRLVLVLDELDATLAQPKLNTQDFYAGLRSLSSTTQGLTILASSRYNLAQLIKLTQGPSTHGSPFLNTLAEVPLSNLGDEFLLTLVELLGDRATAPDFHFVKAISGGQPYLAQMTCSVLWDLRTDGLSNKNLYVTAGKRLSRQLAHHFDDCWRLCSNDAKKVVTAVALAQIPSLLGDRKVKVKDVFESISDYSSELGELETLGILAQPDNGQWIIQQEAFLWWLADEIRRSLRSGVYFSSWLREQEIENLFTRKQRERIELAAKGTVSVLGKGTTSLIEAFAKGLGGMLTG